LFFPSEEYKATIPAHLTGILNSPDVAREKFLRNKFIALSQNFQVEPMSRKIKAPAGSATAGASLQSRRRCGFASPDASHI
jgi:hypothetical protein